MITIQTATLNEIPVLQALAEKTWWPTYSPIISSEQIRYMLDTIYSKQAIQKAIESGSQTFLILYDDTAPQGFASYGIVQKEPQVCKLHKLYVLPQNHKKGYGKMLIEEVKKKTLALGGNILDLNVNRHNPAKLFYEKIGFKILREEDIAIGQYWMNDYVMRLIIPHPALG